jgi:ABC-2 type transport system ATP-binding protein
LSGRRNLELLAALDGGRARARIDEALELAGLTGRSGDKVRGYSLGTSGWESRPRCCATRGCW